MITLAAPARRDGLLLDLATDFLRLVQQNLEARPSLVRAWRILWMLGSSLSWIDLPTAGEGFAILGSHRACDLVLTGDPCIAQRHLAAVLVRSRKCAPHADQLRLFDLQAGVPMVGDDDEPRSTVDAARSFRVGSHVLYAHQVGPADAPDHAGHPPTEVDTAAPVAPRGFGTRRSPSAPVAGTPGRVLLTAQRGDFGAAVELPMETLGGGVVLGRGLRCLDAGIRRVLDESTVSRPHLLLLQDQGDILAFDLGSTSGTRIAGQRIRRHRVRPADTIELGKKVTLEIAAYEG